MSKVNARGEVLKIRSPAEFFAENQNIAGFDNPGKSLFTTIREFVENSLDAAESIHILPEIEISVLEMDEKAFNDLRGVKKHDRVDHTLYGSSSGKKRKKNDGASATTDSTSTETKEKEKPSSAPMYYKITCRDNGVGMKHGDIPDMLGRVLSGSKYGVRQTRGKFGLGAKMALIWAKKSTGMPIEVKTAYSQDLTSPAAYTSYCELDIDIYKNEPNILQHKKSVNDLGWRGTEISVTIGGSWTRYKSRVIQYLQQLAIITPYAQFDLKYDCSFNEKKNLHVRYDKRSDQMPPLACEVKHHPSALNDLLMKQLIDHSKQKTLLKFLIKELSNINKSLAERVIKELGKPFNASMETSSLSTKQIHQLVSLFKQIDFKPPDGTCLSPAGEYNLRLGVIKELDPQLIATHTESAAVFEGHSFIVEAGVSIGGKGVKEGLNVYRFANRIPLLFEAGGDVVTRTAAKSIKWTTYKIDHKKDKIGVFVSIVSTKIPFKGTGKEYIGDDIPELKKAVKHVLQQCCAQLRTKILKSSKSKENALRKKNLTKYIPDVSRAIYGVLTQMTDGTSAASLSNTQEFSTNKHVLSNLQYAKARDLIMKSMGQLSEKYFQDKLHESVEAADETAALEQVTQAGRKESDEQKMFITPLNYTNGFPEPAQVLILDEQVAQIQFFSKT